MIPATQQCFDTSNQFGALLAADLEGPTLPPAGEPNTWSRSTPPHSFWKFHVDFTTPANSTFTGPTDTAGRAYTPLCNGGTCVRQPATNRLDSLADRAMNRLAYRQFSDHEALIISHAVTAGTGGGVRWYELRNPASLSIFQSGTYAPDTAFRWMRSMTFDKDGNIAMGFSTSSSAINPSVRYTGRAGAAAGMMGQGEATFVAGTGSQTGNLTRWGDYSSMNIDPADDCTLWATNEYTRSPPGLVTGRPASDVHPPELRVVRARDARRGDGRPGQHVHELSGHDDDHVGGGADRHAIGDGSPEWCHRDVQPDAGPVG